MSASSDIESRSDDPSLSPAQATSCRKSPLAHDEASLTLGGRRGFTNGLPPLTGPWTFVGDVHGKPAELPVYGPIIQIGDIGIGAISIEDDIRYIRSREDIWFIRGEEDEIAYTRIHPRYLGDWGQHDFLFWLGGAEMSIVDCNKRGHDFSQRHRDELCHEEGIVAFEAYVSQKPRLIVSHDGPSCLFRPDWPMGGWYHASSSPTSLLLQRMFEAHQPEVWIFGHHHKKREFTFNHTRFRCLDVWEALTLTLNSDGTIDWPAGPQPFALRP